jgi:type II secretory pathway pseudopilin PulG
MGRKKLFSLIEIAVAMSVAAIGVAAIMALLPVAVKSTSDSVGDTLAADAANSVIAQLDRAAWEHFDWIQGLKTSKTAVTDAPYSDSKSRDYANMSLGSDESYRIEPDSGLQDGHFAFLFGPPGEAPDFAAEVICWKEDNNNLSLTTVDGETGKFMKPAVRMNTIKHPDKEEEPFVRVFIEVSWPLTKPYKKNSSYPRQSRLFVREYLDPTYYKPVE